MMKQTNAAAADADADAALLASVVIGHKELNFDFGFG
jgi:hypothetical protein